MSFGKTGFGANEIKLAAGIFRSSPNERLSLWRMSSAQASDNEMTEDGIFNAIISNSFPPPPAFSRLLLCTDRGDSVVS